MFRAIRRFIERGRKGYCSEDLWNFDYFLSDFLKRALIDFRKNVHSYPSSDVTWEEWLAIIDEMIDCFAEQNRSIDNVVDELGNLNRDLHIKRFNHKKAKLNRGLELLEKYYYDLWN